MTPDDIADATRTACIAAVAVGQVVGWMWWLEMVRAGRYSGSDDRIWGPALKASGSAPSLGSHLRASRTAH